MRANSNQIPCILLAAILATAPLSFAAGIDVIKSDSLVELGPLGGSSTTFSFDADASADLLVVALSHEKSGGAYSVTYAGEILDGAVSGGSADIWYLDLAAGNYAGGAADLVIDYSGIATVNGVGIGVVSVSAEGQAVELHATGAGDDGSDTVNITTTADDALLVASFNANGGGAMAVGAPLSEIYASGNIGSSRGAAGFEAEVAAGTHAYSCSTSNPRKAVAAAFVVRTDEYSGSIAFVDPFTFTPAPGANSGDENQGIPDRQAGSTLTSTYTETDDIGHPSNGLLLENDNARFGPSDVLLVRTKAIASASQTAADLDRDFGAILAGRKWQIEFDAYAARNSAAVTDEWFAISIGDVAVGAGEAGIRGPNHPSADFAILLRGDGRFTTWMDGALVASGLHSSTARWGDVYHLEIIVDEIGPTPQVSVVYSIGGTALTLGTWPVTWDNLTNRFIELRAHQGGQESESPLMDVRVDNLTIEVTQDIEAPPVLLTPVAGGETWTGDPISLSVAAAGAGPITYQWQLDGVEIPGATDANYLVDVATLADAGLYEVAITNAFGTTTSQATLDVFFPTPEQRSFERLNPSSRRSGIIVSEIHYHPAASTAADQLEFIEIYNSEPWPTDLGGWRLSGDADFVFPDGTTIPPLDYLVVARSVTDVESTYAITGVLGPFTGSLPNSGGSVRLRKPSGAIVWATDYDDRHPWPIAADGTGHSLILARPSYGEASARAWSASHHAGGSPGGPDPIPSGALDHLVINEVLADSVELHNPSPLTVDLSGCYLSNARDLLTKFQLPAETLIGPQGHLVVDEAALGFAPRAGGSVLFLTSADGQRVLDAISFPTAATETALGRYPDGNPNTRLRPLVAPTPGAENAPEAIPDVVINEIFFHAPMTQAGAGDWIELHNRSGGSVNLAGWSFTDGIDFTFGAAATIPAGGYLVVAEDRVELLTNHPSLPGTLVEGEFSGALANGGDRITLSRPDPAAEGHLIEVDTLDYRDQTAYSTLADGRGSSLERRDPGAPSHHESNWADSDESRKAEWTTVEVTGTLAHGNTTAEANPPADVQFFLLGEGEVLVDAVEVIPDGGSDLVTNGGFESGTSGWDFDGSHRDSRVEAGDAFADSNALRLVANRRGDPLANRVRAQLAASIPTGTVATLRARVRWLKGHPEFDLRLKGGWLEGAQTLIVPTNIGTPGASNSRAEASVPPDLSGVVHRPVLPIADLPVRVFAAVADPDGVAGVTLNYRIDPATSFTSVPMHDDGLGGDQLAGDGVFTGRLPAQGDSVLVGFYVEAEDSNGAGSTFPPDAAANGSECLVRFGEPPQPGPFGTYRFWVSEATLADWIATPFLANDPFPATLIYGDQRVLYDGGAYYAGARDYNDSPLGKLTGYDLIMPPGKKVLGTDKLTIDLPIRDVTNQREQLMYHFLDLLKLPSLHRRDIQLFVNGQRRGKLYHDAEQPDRVVVESHFPGDDGDLYKLNNDREGTDDSRRLSTKRRPRLERYEADGQLQFGRYFWNFGPRARGANTRTEMQPIFNLITAADSDLPSYAEDLAAIVDIENWMRTFAMNDLASFWDGFGNPNYKNTYLYKPETRGWTLFSWDFDVGLGVFNDPANAPLFATNVDPNVRRVYTVPAFERAYWRTIDEALGDWFSGAAVTPRLQQRFDAYQAAGLKITSPFVPSGTGMSIPAWIDERRIFIEGEFAGIDDGFAITSPADNSSTAVSEITITGTAPVAAATIEINGRELVPDFSSLTEWSARLTLRPGENSLLIRALDLQGNEVASQTVAVEFTGSADWPELRINEWMADNASTIADPEDGDFDDWIELHNPTDSMVDLEGWSITDDPTNATKFVFPSGTSIAAGGFLLLWADGESHQADPPLHLNFRLSAGGEGIALFAPDGTQVDRIDFGDQAQDFSYGIPDGGSAAERGVLTSPSPGGQNSSAPPAIDPVVSLDGESVDLRIHSAPGFTYTVEASTDLATWIQDGDPVTATSASLTFELDPTDGERLFVRVRRSP